MILEITTTYGRYIKISFKKSYENVYKKSILLKEKAINTLIYQYETDYLPSYVTVAYVLPYPPFALLKA